MTLAPQAKSSLSKFLFFAILLVIGVVVGYFVLLNRPWVVPEDAKRVPNPIARSVEALAAGRSAYLDKCAECHGDSGKGDGPQAKKYSPGPSDLTDPRLAAESDGELFYKITQGHRPMPSFRKRLSDTQRWQLVLLIRELSKPVAPPERSSK